MEIVLKLSLWVHIAAGIAALVSGAIAIGSKKGQKTHRLNGKIYFWSMISVVATALLISIYKDITFLLLIAIFSLYMTYTGYRVLKSKAQKANILDWLMVVAGFISVIFMITSLKLILMIFGIILASFVIPDLLRFLYILKIPNKLHLILHISRMMGAYIATFTAFIVVNVNFNPAWIVWLAPTAVCSLAISYFIRKYSKTGYKSLG